MATKQKSITETGSITEGIAGVTAAILAVMGLAGIFTEPMITLATIVVGVGLLIKGGIISSRLVELVSSREEPGVRAGREETARTEAKEESLASAKIGMTMSPETLGGLTGIVLGIIVFFNVYPQILIASAIIVYGASILLGSGVDFRVNAMNLLSWEENTFNRRVETQALASVMDSQIFIGLGAITLGILALLNIAPAVLSLVALLAIGISQGLEGITMLNRFIHVFSYR